METAGLMNDLNPEATDWLEMWWKGRVCVCVHVRVSVYMCMHVCAGGDGVALLCSSPCLRVGKGYRLKKLSQIV